MLAATLLVGQLSLKVLFRAGLVIACVATLVANNPRLQRFTELQNTDAVASRVRGSVNESFLLAVVDYPMGNGLGGGGTSVPYFLQDRLTNPVFIENEYGLIVLEEGIPGLIIWIAFLVWAVTSRLPKGKGTRYLGLALARAYAGVLFGTAMLGTGILTSIPMTPLLFVYLGWMSTARASAAASEKAQGARVSPTYFAAN